MGEDYTVLPLRQGTASLLPEERLALGSEGRGRCLIREVLLKVDSEALVFARSVTSRRATQGPWKAVLKLGRRPLADLLFTKLAAVHRSELASLRVSPGSPLHRLIVRHLEAVGEQPTPPVARIGTCWARCSLFWRRGSTLRVLEVFLPALEQRICPARQHKRILRRR